MANRRFAVLLVFVAIVGVITSLVAWCFLELVHQIQTGVFTDLPKDLDTTMARRTGGIWSCSQSPG